MRHALALLLIACVGSGCGSTGDAPVDPGPNATLDSGIPADDSGLSAGPGCGNGVKEPGEACDGADLAGETCETHGYSGGDLACNGDCSFDFGTCQEAAEGRLAK